MFDQAVLIYTVSRRLGERNLDSMPAYLGGTFFCLSFGAQNIQTFFGLGEIQIKEKVQPLFLL